VAATVSLAGHQELFVPAIHPTAGEVTTRFTDYNLSSLFFLVWFTGLAIMLGRIITGQVLLSRRIRKAPMVRDQRTLSRLQWCKEQLGVTRSITLLETRDNESPALTGIIHPVILLPRHLIGSLNTRELDMVLLHELAHVRRNDLLFHYLMLLARACHWFNPAAWFACRQLMAEREAACDVMVLNQIGTLSRPEYGHLLLDISQRPMNQSAVMNFGSATARALKKRINDIVRPAQETCLPLGQTLLIALAIVGMTGVSQPPVAAMEAIVSGQPIVFPDARLRPSALAMRQAKAHPRQVPAARDLIGQLYKPEGDGPFAAVVLTPDCFGVQPYQQEWAQLLADSGYVALLVDSLGSRQREPYCDRLLHPKKEYSAWYQLDAFAGLEYLIAQSFVDPDRVAIMGWSQFNTLQSVASYGMQQLYINNFHAAVALHPNCGMGSIGHYESPVLILVGEKDDWTPAAYCESLARRAANLGPASITLHVYPDALHGFDNPGLEPPRYEAGIQNWYKKPHWGVTLGYNANAHADAKNRVLEFLAMQLGN
jgi:beta-lactamase regulating signal transducer with metallopeptidase domain/dienelactone hydrolase